MSEGGWTSAASGIDSVSGEVVPITIPHEPNQPTLAKLIGNNEAGLNKNAQYVPGFPEPKMNTVFSVRKFFLWPYSTIYFERGIMSIRANILCGAILLSLGLVFPPMAISQTSTESSGQLRTHRFQLEDYRRRYMLYSPRHIDNIAGPRPLVLVIHGGASSDRGMMKLDKKRWRELADEHGFYVVYPNAVNKLWDFGEGQTSSDLDNRVDDLAYFHRVLDDVARRKNIDQSRVFATGISRGGQSSYYLACNMPERIRAIMPVAMSLPKFMENECRSGPPVGVAIVNGTADPQVPYEGGWIKVFRKKRDIVLSTDETAALWRTRNGCRVSPVSTTNIDKPGDETSVSSSEWTKCSGAPVKLYKVNNGGHTWPSGVQYLSTRIVGETSKDISAAEEGWAFFSQF